MAWRQGQWPQQSPYVPTFADGQHMGYAPPLSPLAPFRARGSSAEFVREKMTPRRPAPSDGAAVRPATARLAPSVGGAAAVTHASRFVNGPGSPRIRGDTHHFRSRSGTPREAQMNLPVQFHGGGSYSLCTPIPTPGHQAHTPRTQLQGSRCCTQTVCAGLIGPAGGTSRGVPGGGRIDTTGPGCAISNCCVALVVALFLH